MFPFSVSVYFLYTQPKYYKPKTPLVHYSSHKPATKTKPVSAMSSADRVYRSPSKRRRVLSDIANTKGGTLGFDMANINHSNSDFKQPSLSIPLPSREMSHRINLPALRNKENSRIPTKVDNYIAMNTSLTEKSKIRLPKFEVSYERDRLQENARVEREVDALRAKLNGIDEQVLRAADNLHSLLDVNEDFQSRTRQLLRQRSELREQNCKAQKEFDATEARVNSTVAHEEKMMHLQLKEFELKLRDDYNEAKFQLEQQVKESHFVDSKLTNEGDALQLEKEKLKQLLQDAIDKKNKMLAAELAAMESELEEALQEKRQQVENASAEYRVKQERFEKVMKEHEDITKDVAGRKSSASELSVEIDKLNRKLDTFEEEKMQREQDLQRLNDELRWTQGDDLDWQARLVSEKEKYLKVCQKHENYMTTRRNLEHSIMNFSDKTRLYLRISGEDYTIINDKEAIVGEIHYKFDKVGSFKEEGPDQDDKYSLEWRLPSSEALMKNDVSIIFSGSFPRQSSYNLINTFSYLTENEARFKSSGWSISYNLQSLLIDSSTVDLLNNSTETALDFLGNKLNVISQRMRVHNLSDLVAVKGAQNPNKAVCHVITTEASRNGQTVTHRLFIVNISNIPPDLQAQYFAETAHGNLQQLLSYLALNTKLISVCDIKADHRMLLDQITRFHR